MRVTVMQKMHEKMVEDVLKIGLLGCSAISRFAHLPALVRAWRVVFQVICVGAEDLLHVMGQRVDV